jgi:aspartate oxidase
LLPNHKSGFIDNQPLFAMNNQHVNGGLSANTWGRTSLEACDAIGEATGTHG